MPYYVQLTRIDWHVAETSPELRALLPRASFGLSSSNHTDETFDRDLRAFAAEHPDVVADALVEDGFRQYWLFRARGGKVTRIEVEERPEDDRSREIDLPFDEMATVKLVRDADEIVETLEACAGFDDSDDDEIQVPLQYSSESAMREVLDRIARAIDEGEHRFVAEVDLDRFLVEVRPGAARVRKLAIVTEPELVMRLLRGSYEDVPDPPADPEELREQAFYFPEPMLQAIQEEAFRLDTSLSRMIAVAWRIAGGKIVEARDHGALAPALEPFAGDKRKQTLYVRGATLAAVAEQASRLDSSLSFVVQSAWALAKDQIASQPTVDPSE